MLHQGLEAKTRDSAIDSEGRNRYFKIMSELAQMKKKREDEERESPNIRLELN